MPLKDELQQSEDKHQKLGQRNYVVAYVLAASSAVASVSTAITTAGGFSENHRSIVAVLACIPAAVLAANAILKFDSKAAFHWKKSKRMRALRNALEYEGKTEAEVSAKRSEVEAETERDWQPFGGLTAPTNSSQNP